MQQILFGGINSLTLPSQFGTRYYNQIVGGRNGSTWTLSTSLVLSLITAPGTLTNFFVKLSSAPGMGQNHTFYIVVNGVETALSVVIADTNAQGSDTVNSVTVAAGDTVMIAAVGTAGAGNKTVRWSVRFTGDNAGESLMPANSTLSKTATIFYSLMSNGSGGESEYIEENAIPTGGVIKDLYVQLSADPGGSPDAYKFTIRKNRVDTSLTTTITADDTTGSDIVNTVDVTAGDRVCLKVEPLNVPNVAPIAYWGVTFVATSDGESIVVGHEYPSLSFSTTNKYNYLAKANGNIGWETTESDTYQCGQVCTLKNLYIACFGLGHTAGLSRIVTLRANGADTNLTASMRNVASIANDTTNSYSASNFDDLNLEFSFGDEPTLDGKKIYSEIATIDGLAVSAIFYIDQKAIDTTTGVVKWSMVCYIVP